MSLQFAFLILIRLHNTSLKQFCLSVLLTLENHLQALKLLSRDHVLPIQICTPKFTGVYYLYIITIPHQVDSLAHPPTHTTVTLSVTMSHSTHISTYHDHRYSYFIQKQKLQNTQSILIDLQWGSSCGTSTPEEFTHIL